jgi:hypothetical protein
MAGDVVAGAGDGDLFQVGDDLDETADDRGVDRVIVGGDPDEWSRARRVEVRQPTAGATGGSVTIAARSASRRSVGRHSIRP